MTMSHRLGFAAIAVAATVLLGACSTPIAKTDSQPPTPPTKQQDVPPTSGYPAGGNGTHASGLAPYLDPSNPLSQKRSVYFDFDQYTLKSEYMPLLEMHGKYLAAHTNVNIKVQGNTDEQGGAEYNLALGQKRAEAVVKALKVYGVQDAQLEAVSYGKEKPQNLGHDEAARAQNRRADLAYPDK